MNGIYISLTVLALALYVFAGRFIGGIVLDGHKKKTDRAYARAILFGAFWPLGLIYCAIWWACWIVYHAFKKEDK